jgi:AraC-like DNA-binding protein
MDPLSDVLSLLKPRTYLTAGFDAGGDWAVRFDDQAGQIKCYAVMSGGCRLAIEGLKESFALTAGECFVLPTGRSFTLASDLALAARPAHEIFALPRRAGVVVHNGGGGVFLAGCRFEVDGRHAARLLRSLPPVLHLHAESEQTALRWSIQRMQAELRDQRPGGTLMAQHLAHMMLVQALRLSLDEFVSVGVGWFFALADPQLNAAIGAIHENPAYRWTLGGLAARAGLSRSVFARRFREQVGETPIAYLTRWRMTLAAEQLTTGRRPLAQTAFSLGYASETAFNTAFKRVMGCSPRRYARSEPSLLAGGSS